MEEKEKNKDVVSKINRAYMRFRKSVNHFRLTRKINFIVLNNQLENRWSDRKTITFSKL